MKSKSLYIFDMDGTLFNTLGDLSVAVNYALQTFGLKTLSTEKIKSYIGNGSLKLVERSLEGADAPLLEVHQCYSEFYAKHCLEKTEPYPGVVEFLKSFPAKKALATNKPHIPGLALLKHFELDSYFDAFAFGDEETPRKPDAAPFLKILKATGTAKEDAIMVGDDAPDILGAKNAGIDSVFIENGFGKRSSFAPVEPTYSIPHFSDLSSLQFR
ncbi:MAG: HAD-IA family hydrolase [Fibrobacter sp.]|nr:HAD-IA family hydrolase [Fibrobacter sp.]